MPIAALRLRATGGGAPGVPTFTFSNAKLLVHGSARPFIDSSLGKKPVVNFRLTCSLSSGKIAFSSSSAGLFVRGSDTDWQFGTGAWFISAKVAAGTYSSSAPVFDTRPSVGSANGWVMAIQATTRAPFIVVEGTTYGVGTPAANLLMASGSESTASFSYDGTDLRCFVDGSLSWTHTVSLNIDTGNAIFIGNSAGPGSGGNSGATLRELLIVKGEVVATSSFTVPSTWTDTGIVIESWNPVTYSNVKLNCHMAGTNGGTTFSDTSAGTKTVTPNGNAQTSTAQARIGSSSGLFDGTGDYLTVPDSADWDFGTGDLSVECQIRPANITSRQCVISNYLDSTTGWTSQINLTNNGRWNVNVTGDGSELDTNSLQPVVANAWQHLAFSRVSGFLMAFYEGELIDSVADTQNITGSTQALYFGRLTTVLTTVDFNGHAQELRVIKGEGYPRSFIVQSAAHPDS